MTEKTYAPLATIKGTMGKAARLDTRQRVIDEGYDPAHDGTVASWVMFAPYAHPIWPNFILHLSHLRPIDRGEGPIPTKFYLDGATHELWLMAVDPDYSFDQIVDSGMWAGKALRPSNFAAQIIAPSDEAAASRIEQAVRHVCDGTLNPDEDNRRAWERAFGDNMIKDEYRRP